MRKTIIALLLTAMALSSTGCGGDTSSVTTENTTSQTEATTTTKTTLEMVVTTEAINTDATTAVTSTPPEEVTSEITTLPKELSDQELYPYLWENHERYDFDFENMPSVDKLDKNQALRNGPSETWTESSIEPIVKYYRITSCPRVWPYPGALLVGKVYQINTPFTLVSYTSSGYYKTDKGQYIYELFLSDTPDNVSGVLEELGFEFLTY